MDKRIIDMVIILKNNCIRREDLIREEFSISPAEYRSFLAIDPLEESTAGALSKKMELSMSRGSRIIEKLVNKGYLEQIHSDDDRRCIKLKLTDKGVLLKKKIDKMLDECEREIKSKVPDAELTEMMNSLEKLTYLLKSNTNRKINGILNTRNI